MFCVKIEKRVENFNLKLVEFKLFFMRIKTFWFRISCKRGL